ncbi:MAG TPA: hypothetical protein VIL77_08085 [Gaiellaceae bacterium]
MRIAFLLSAALLLAGCGSGSHSASSNSAYEHQMAALVPQLQSKLLKLRFSLEQQRGPRNAQLQLQQIEQRLRSGIATLQALQPPANVATEHASLIAGYRALLGDFAALNPAARRKTTAALRVQAGKLSSAASLQEIGTALKAIIAKGYALGFPPGS